MPTSAPESRFLTDDIDARQSALRQYISARLEQRPPPVAEDAVVASYFLALRSLTLAKVADEIAYHATSAVKNPPPGSLLAQCTANAIGVDAFDATGRVGVLHIAFPLKMMLQPDGHLTSCDLLHTVAAAIVFDVFENQDVRLLSLQIPPGVLRTFPGPAHGPAGFRRLAKLSTDAPAFGTILKPTAGITAEDVGQLVENVASSPLLSFIKEDEDLYPNLDYSPIGKRVKLAMDAIRRAADRRGGRGLVYLAHCTAAPHEILDHVAAALDAGANGVMFSETFAGGTVRMVREAFKNRHTPPLIYGHNAGIGTRTGAIWREVIDLLARLDGIDFRQTAPLRPGTPFLRPHGMEWLASESTLARSIDGINPTTIVRAGALDQGNIGLNLRDARRRGIEGKIMFLAGSAINSIHNERGQNDAKLGAAAMQQAIDIHTSGELDDTPDERYLGALAKIAADRKLTALLTALRQRYPGEVQ